MTSAPFGNAFVFYSGSPEHAATTGEDVVANPLREHYAEMLLARIRSDKHPSAAHMALLESVASDRMLVAYILALMEKIENDPNPSIPMMKRVQGLIERFGG